MTSELREGVDMSASCSSRVSTNYANRWMQFRTIDSTIPTSDMILATPNNCKRERKSRRLSLHRFKHSKPPLGVTWRTLPYENFEMGAG